MIVGGFFLLIFYAFGNICHYKYVGFEKSNLLLVNNLIYFINNNNEIISVDINDLKYNKIGNIPFLNENFFYILSIKDNELMAISNIGNIYYGSLQNMKFIGYLSPPIFFPFKLQNDKYALWNNNSVKIFQGNKNKEELFLYTNSNILYNQIIYPLVINDLIILSDLDGILYICKDYQIIKEIFLNRIVNKNTNNLQLHSPNLLNNTIIVSNYNGDVFGISLKDFSILWKIKNIYTFLDGYCDKNNVYFFDKNNLLIIVNEDGSFKIKNIGVLKNLKIYRFYIIDKKLIVFTDNKIITIYNDFKNYTIYKEITHKYFAPIILDKKMYFINRNGVFVVLDI
ncbi:hypothetical protein AB836_00625 [Rickettsiales bacterium (ex Bugula neritina AB1)]|nr:hypothetical protein AB836_00625 [Rickettsiales bacterium (ex Bugula neritina AB1)]